MGQKLGQHFLKGTWAARALARAAGIGGGDTVLEIGPGKGALTRELLATGAHVIAIEKDEGLVTKLREVFKNEIAFGQFTLVEDDVRNFNPDTWRLKPGTYILAANIPYYITGEIIRTFLTTGAQPRTMALLVQKEVANRIVARDKKESILSLSVKAFGMPKIAAKVPRENFSPPPKVDSAILVVEDISRDFFQDVDEENFFSVVRAGFAKKRKMLVSNLSEKFSKENVLAAFAACGIDVKIRAEDVPLPKWRCLTKHLDY